MSRRKSLRGGFGFLAIVGGGMLAACSVDTSGIHFIDDDSFERAKTPIHVGGDANNGVVPKPGSGGKAGTGSGGAPNGGVSNGGAPNAGAPNGGASPTAGRASGGSSSGTGGAGSVGGGVPIVWTDGWVDGANPLKVQGAVFGYGDSTSLTGMTSNFVGAHACIKGMAAKVDMTSTVCTTETFPPPVTDCFGYYWGVAIGLNLKQDVDPTTDLAGPPMPYDATAIKGFSFKITGAVVPTSLRFKVQDANDGEFCTPKTLAVRTGSNTINLSQLIEACWAPKAGAATADTAKKRLIQLAWQVVTTELAPTPYDYCIEDLRATQ